MKSNFAASVALLVTGILASAFWRWAGKENTHLIRPGGKVKFIGNELRKLVKPDSADERSFYMNVAANGLSKEGFEVAAMTNDEIVMKRAVER